MTATNFPLSTITAILVITATAVIDGTAIGDVTIALLPEMLEQLTELAVDFCGVPCVNVEYEDSTVSFAYGLAQRAVAKESPLDLNLLFDRPVINAVDTALMEVGITNTKTQDHAGIGLSSADLKSEETGSGKCRSQSQQYRTTTSPNTPFTPTPP